MTLSLPFLKDAQGLVDGGYLSFVHGTRTDGNFGGWSLSRLKYIRDIIAMDSDASVRRDLYPEYKIKRRIRRLADPIAMARYEQVIQFRRILVDDPSLMTVELPGYEADDLVAYLFIMGIGNTRVVTKDKDMLMVPGLAKAMVDSSGMSLDRALKLPKYAQPPTHPIEFVMTQCLWGDKSDSIPRLLPSHPTLAKSLYRYHYQRWPKTGDKFRNLYQHFGEAFLNNLSMVLVPHPSLTHYDYHDAMVIGEALCGGHYWRPESYVENILLSLEQSIERKLAEDW